MREFLEIKLEVEVAGEYVLGTKPYFDKQFGNWLPGDPSEIVNIKVYLNKSNRRIDITDALPRTVMKHIEDEMLERAYQEYVVDGESA